MSLKDAGISREPNGTFNAEYCKWCYDDGKSVCTGLEELLNFLESHVSNAAWYPEQAGAYFEDQIPKLNQWKQEETNYLPLLKAEQIPSPGSALCFILRENDKVETDR